MDKVTYEIIRNGLYAIAREMKVAMMQTAGSPIIHSGAMRQRPSSMPRCSS